MILLLVFLLLVGVICWQLLLFALSRKVMEIFNIDDNAVDDGRNGK